MTPGLSGLPGLINAATGAKGIVDEAFAKIRDMAEEGIKLLKGLNKLLPELEKLIKKLNKTVDNIDKTIITLDKAMAGKKWRRWVDTPGECIISIRSIVFARHASIKRMDRMMCDFPSSRIYQTRGSVFAMCVTSTY